MKIFSQGFEYNIRSVNAQTKVKWSCTVHTNHSFSLLYSVLQLLYFITASLVFFNGHILKYCGESLSHWLLCSHFHRDLLSLCSAPTASAHYLIFSTHGRPSAHFHVIECFLGRSRALMQRALYSHTVSCLVNTALRKMRLHVSPRAQISSKNHRPQQKCCFSWRLRSQQSITQTTVSSDPHSHWCFITQLSSVWSFISCTDHLFR